MSLGLQLLLGHTLFCVLLYAAGHWFPNIRGGLLDYWYGGLATSVMVMWRVP